MKYLADARAQEPEITPEGAQRRVLSYGANLMAVEFTFESGVETAMHSHPHEQVGYVVSGALELYMAGIEATRLDAGCSYYVPPHTSHGVRILEPTLLLDCFTPAREDLLA